MEPTFRLADQSDVDRLIDFMSLGRVWMIDDGRDTFGYVVLETES